jgi:hypothetical protein
VENKEELEKWIEEREGRNRDVWAVGEIWCAFIVSFVC